MPPCATFARQESNGAAASLLDGEDKDQVHTTEGGDTLAGNEFDKARKARDHELIPHRLSLIYFPHQLGRLYLCTFINNN